MQTRSAGCKAETSRHMLPAVPPSTLDFAPYGFPLGCGPSTGNIVYKVQDNKMSLCFILNPPPLR